MAADVYSARIGFIKQGTGNNNNNWGTVFNASFTDLLDKNLTGKDDRAVTGGSLDLSGGTLPPAGPSPVSGYVQNFTGVLTSAQHVIFPALGGRWLIYNGTTGAFPLLMKNSGGTEIEIPQGTFKLVWSDGTSMFRLDKDDIGVIFDHAGASAPFGSMLANGASLLRADHPDLFTVIGTTWGAVDGTHFTLPDFVTNNRFRRAAGGALALGTYQTSQNLAHTHTGSGTTTTESADHTHTYSGTTSTESASHTHSYNPSNANSGGVTGGGGFGLPMLDTSASTGTQSANHTHTYSGTSSGKSATHTHTYSFTTSGGSADGTEARPNNGAVTVCIRY